MEYSYSGKDIIQKGSFKEVYSKKKQEARIKKEGKGFEINKDRNFECFTVKYY